MSDSADTATQRSEAFPFSEWQLGVEEAANRLSGRVKQCARNAFIHLRKAWRLHGIDDEMSAFRAITAEEEAATALIQALKVRGYSGADRLRPWKHVHKSAFWPLIAAVNQVLLRSRMPAPRVVLSRKGPPRVRVNINVTELAGGNGEPVWAEPDQPLNFAIRSGNALAPLIHLFEEEFAELASEAGENSIKAYVERQANTRNLLLYASDDGVPAASFQDDMLHERARRVCVLVIIAMIVMQTRQRQLFVTQCLEAVLRALDTFNGPAFDYTEADDKADRTLVTIHTNEQEPAQISVRRPIDVGTVWDGSLGRRWGKRPPYSVSATFAQSSAQPDGEKD
jgi:hypothetical protein